MKRYVLLFMLFLMCQEINADIQLDKLGSVENRVFVIDEKEYQYMRDVGSTLTDKFDSHDYAAAYSHYFRNIRDCPIKLLEIGVLFGGSLLMWENYFKNAEIHGVDVTLDYVKYDLKRAICHIADQSKPEDLLRVVNDCGGSFDIIVDDGGHLMDQQIISFVTLFPYLNSGGIYIVEDLHTSYWRSHGGSGTQENPSSIGHTMISFLKDLVDDVNFVGAATGHANHNLKIAGCDIEAVKDSLNDYRKDILSIHFYDSLCFVIKR